MKKKPKKEIEYIGGQAINLKNYMEECKQKNNIRQKTIDLQKIKTDVRVKAQELAKANAKFFGYPYKNEKGEE